MRRDVKHGWRTVSYCAAPQADINKKGEESNLIFLTWNTKTHTHEIYVGWLYPCCLPMNHSFRSKTKRVKSLTIPNV